MGFEPKIGEIFDDKYELLELLGSGGNGIVYKALQRDSQRTVALKILHAAQDEEFKVRFVREAQILHTLQHANIVAVYHLGHWNGQPYLAMEFLEGQNLRVLLNATQKMPVLRALKIIRDAASALAFSHKNGIVHRDLKPENIILTQSPEPDTVKIVDFGLAKLAVSTEQKLTTTGNLIGTASYMSPEQSLGKSVDFRTDIYSLSLCLYEMIVGEKPFDADSAIGLMYKHINEPIPPVKPEDTDQFHPGINELLSRGLAKDPAKRFSSMEEFANEIDATILKLQNGRQTNTRKNITEIAVTMTILTIGLLCGFAMFHKIKTKTNQIKSIAELSPSTATSERNSTNKINSERLYKKSLATTIKNFGEQNQHTAEALEKLADFYHNQNNDKEAIPYLERAAKIREQSTPPENLALSRDLTSLAGIYDHTTKDSAKIESFFKRSIKAMKQVNPFSNETAARMTALACYYQANQRRREAEAVFGDAISMVENSANPDEPYLVDCLVWSASNCRELAEYSKAESQLNEALSISEKIYSPDDIHLVDCLNGLLKTYRMQGKNPYSQQNFMTALTATEPANNPVKTSSLKNNLGMGRYADRSINKANSYFVLSQIYNDLGKFDKAESALRKTITIRQNETHPHYTELSGSYSDLGDLLAKLGRNPESEILYKKALQTAQAAAGGESQMGNVLFRLARTNTEQRKFVLADDQFKQSLELLVKAHADNPGAGEILQSLFWMVVNYTEQHKDPNDVPVFKETLTKAYECLNQAQSRNLTNEVSPDVYQRMIAESLTQLANIYLRMGDTERAEKLLLRALDLGKKVLSPFDLSLATTKQELAEIYGKRGQFDKANALYEEVMTVWKKQAFSDKVAVANCAFMYAENCKNQGDKVRAANLYEQALSCRQSIYLRSDFRIEQCLNGLADVYRSLGKQADLDRISKLRK